MAAEGCCRSSFMLRKLELADSIPFSPALADVRTTISWPAGTSHKFMDSEDRRSWGISDSLVRLSVGIDAVQDVIAELDRALGKL